MAPWFSEGESIDRQKFITLLNVYPSDPELNLLLDQAVRITKVDSRQDLYPLFSVCPAGEKSNLAHTDIKDFTYWNALTPPGYSVSWKSPQAQSDINLSYQMVESRLSTHIELKGSILNGICFKAGIPLARAVITLTHELAHYVDHQMTIKDNMLQYADAQNFASEVLYAKGGEYAAYQMQMKTLRALQKEFQIDESELNISRLSAFFDHDGRVINPEGLETFILSDYPSGLGYAKTFKLEYREQLIRSEKSLTSLIDWLTGGLAQSIQTNITKFSRTAREYEDILPQWSAAKRTPEQDRKYAEMLVKYEQTKSWVKFYSTYQNDLYSNIGAINQRLSQTIDQIRNQ